MIRINLLPHREMRRERRKKDFVGLAVLSVLLSGAVALSVAFGISNRIDAQQARNDFIVKENEKLDAQIKEIALLKQEIDSLTARQHAVENLQRDRTLPVHVLDELVKHTPTGIYYKQMRQEERKVVLIGLAQSNEHVSSLLRGLANDTPWLERPELIEIKATSMPQAGNPAVAALGKDARRVFEFSMTAMVKAPVVVDPSKPGAKPAVKPVAQVDGAPAPLAANSAGNSAGK